jgi:hypothetical protein
MSAGYTLNDTQKMQFAGIYLLEYMINHPKRFAVLLLDEEEDLEPILEWLLVREYVEIKDDSSYLANEKGRTALTKFMARYADFLNIYDIYCAVDLGVGEFAFTSYFDYPDRSSWRHFLAAERWEDLRIAVAEFKGIDPIEIVFMSYLSEGRFGRDQIGWQFDLLLGSVWDEILDLCNNAVQLQQLGYEDAEGTISGETVMRDIVTQATSLLIQLKQQEADLAKGIHHEGTASEPLPGMVTPVDLPEHDIDYYERYNDPDYRPPHSEGRWHL